jgi:hypothetical protein
VLVHVQFYTHGSDVIPTRMKSDSGMSFIYHPQVNSTPERAHKIEPNNGTTQLQRAQLGIGVPVQPPSLAVSPWSQQPAHRSGSSIQSPSQLDAVTSRDARFGSGYRSVVSPLCSSLKPIAPPSSSLALVAPVGVALLLRATERRVL